MSLLKVVLKNSTVYRLIAYARDLRVFIVDIRTILVDNHPQKEVFADKLDADTSGLIVTAAKVDLENSEAVDATAIKDKYLQDAADIARQIRDFGLFTSTELEFEPTPENLIKSRQMRTACGVGKPINLKRLSGVNRLLELQSMGLGRIMEDDDSQLAMFKTQVDEAITKIRAATDKQVKEKMEAQLAYDELVIKSTTAIETINRTIRLFNAFKHNISDDMLNTMRGLQGRHYNVFSSTPKPSEPEDQETSV